MTTDELVSIRKAALLIDTAESVVRGWISRGWLPSQKVEGLTMVSMADVNKVQFQPGARIRDGKANGKHPAPWQRTRGVIKLVMRMEDITEEDRETTVKVLQQLMDTLVAVKDA